ncbi:class I SAM-dependent rRNA methyltransferase [Solimonas marina]|uniref:Class I SAM-dependent rRNA methyltransferase n=1 Tax=Solimonas marina TaxID=2714601 RepID=A0A969W867_9GAMM|nr:class I SAM-dependent rRNA methyltransferase [Solimonas marina]NKF22412.1 class I SAM-dependent rRNA methyltransferase [Solimonas marina]
MLTIKLRPREERRLRAGHLWVYSNEIDAGPEFRHIAPGSLCRVHDSRDKPLGIGYVNPKTLLAVRLLSGNVDVQIDRDWFVRRLTTALALRERLYGEPFYRLVYGEGDGLPGLVIDRYGDVLVVQITTAGMEALKTPLIEALHEVFKPRGMLLRNENAARELEGLPQDNETIGNIAEPLDVFEDGLCYPLSLTDGQKTGFFFDQRDNRSRLARYVQGRSVLDVFSYVGAWGLRALRDGAASATCVDSSQTALDVAQASAQRNGLSLETIRGDALATLKALRGEGRQFDVVVVDPPALIKRRKDHEAGLAHYAALNRAAMHLLAADGILVSCSCSHHLSADELQRVLLRESRQIGRRLRLLESGAQGPDHPVHPAIPETRYLKAFYCAASAE